MKKNKIVLAFLLTAAMIFAAGCGSTTKETTQPTQAVAQNETTATAETAPASGQEETQTPSGDGQNGQNGNAQNPFANGNGITGEVTAVGDASITVKDSTGAETEYKVTESTTISKMNVSAGGFNGQTPPSGSGDGQNPPQMPNGSGDGQGAPSGFDGQTPPSGSGNGQNPPAGFNGQTPPSGSDGQNPPQMPSGSGDGQNMPQMPSGSGDGSGFSGFSGQVGETISLSDITVGNTAMITLADDGSAATIMVSDGSFEKPALDGESGATPTTESAADNGNT